MFRDNDIGSIQSDGLERAKLQSEQSLLKVGARMRPTNPSRLHAGYTLAEILIVVAILGMVIDQLLRLLEKSLAGWGTTTAV